jgi:hypothetical protein
LQCTHQDAKNSTRTTSDLLPPGWEKRPISRRCAQKELIVNNPKNTYGLHLRLQSTPSNKSHLRVQVRKSHLRVPSQKLTVKSDQSCSHLLGQNPLGFGHPRKPLWFRALQEKRSIRQSRSKSREGWARAWGWRRWLSPL